MSLCGYAHKYVCVYIYIARKERPRLFKKRLVADVACGSIAKKPAIAPTEEKAVPVAAEPAAPKTKRVVVEPPEGIVPYLNWTPIPPNHEHKVYFKDSTIWVIDSSFMVVQNDRKSYSWHPYNGKDITREDAWKQTLEYLRKIYESVA